MLRTPLIWILAGCWHVSGAIADESDEALAEGGLIDLDAEAANSTTTPRDMGIELASSQDRFTLHAWLRSQVRWSNPFDSDPRTLEAFADPPGSDIEFRRARLKMEGQLGRPGIEYYFEHELSDDRPLLDLRVDLEWQEFLYARVGQYKVLYNRERVDSSGKQTFAERSISTYAFTLDRQRGATVAAHWGKGSRANQWLMLGVFQGDGRDPGPRGDGEMIVARWQWNFLGEGLGFSQSELKNRDVPAASFALGAASTEGPYTRFSSSGGGQLDGFEAGGTDRYRLRQAMQEFAWHYAGYSIQQELHIKKIRDRELGTESTLLGGYAQLGKVWSTSWRPGGLPVELAGRFARVDWRDTPADRDQTEFTVATNLFFDGHNNKITADISRIGLSTPEGSDSDIRWRLQWDVSF